MTTPPVTHPDIEADRQAIKTLTDSLVSFTKLLKLWQLPMLLPIMGLLLSLLLLAYSLEALQRLRDLPTGTRKGIAFLLSLVLLAAGNLLAKPWLMFLALLLLGLALRMHLRKGSPHADQPDPQS